MTKIIILATNTNTNRDFCFYYKLIKNENNDNQIMIKINKNEENDRIIYKCHNLQEKIMILRYLIYLYNFIPIKGYIMNNYDYDYDYEQSDNIIHVYNNNFNFIGNKLKFIDICNEIKIKMPKCCHYTTISLNKYIFTNKICNKCIANNNNNIYNINNYLYFLYEFFNKIYKCPFEITNIIIKYIKPVDMVSKELKIFFS
jgi:hypothetical protein